MNDKTAVLILAAGLGRRMGAAVNKQYLNILGKPVLARTIARFLASPALKDAEILVVINTDERDLFERDIRAPYGLDVRTVTGGATRQISAYNGLRALSPDTRYVLIHDGARPFVSEAVIADCLEKTKRCGAAVAALPAVNTIKAAPDGKFIAYTPERSALYEAQTPQGFECAALMRANAQALEDGFAATDDASLIEHAGGRVALSRGDRCNIKITVPEDLLFAEALARQQGKEYAI